MNAQCTPVDGDLVDTNSFFAPVAYNKIDDLLSEFTYKKNKINSFSNAFIAEIDEVSRYFGNYYCRKTHSNAATPPSLEYLKNKEGAIKALEAEYWNKTIDLTGVLAIMNESRRSEWQKQISNYETVDFSRNNIETTVLALLADRERFFAERVDGVFKALSGEHVTNQPEGFSKRMIIDNAHDGRFGVFTNYKKIGFLHDLRVIVRKFAGLKEENHTTTSGLIRAAYKVTGNWILIDGGNIKLRVYKKGTAHVEISPDMTWKLNNVLAYLYPSAIPPKFRKKPIKQHKEFNLMERPLPSAVVSFLSNKVKQHLASIDFYNYGEDRHVVDEAISVLEQIGGVRTITPTTENKHRIEYSFDYPVCSIIDEIIKTGEIPHHKSYQFYPTPISIAEKAIEIADIGETDECLEPSAGIGNIADLMPKDRTTCVEISELHSKILKEKEFKVINGDFLKLAESTSKRFDKIVMNPPYSEGRWQAHIEAASKLLSANGRLVAILPASAKGKELIKGFKHTYTNTFDNEFKSTSISTVIVSIE